MFSNQGKRWFKDHVNYQERKNRFVTEIGKKYIQRTVWGEIFNLDQEQTNKSSWVGKRKWNCLPHPIKSLKAWHLQHKIIYSKRNNNIPAQNPLLKKKKICVICCKIIVIKKGFLFCFLIHAWKKSSTLKTRIQTTHASGFGIAENRRSE